MLSYVRWIHEDPVGRGLLYLGMENAKRFAPESRASGSYGLWLVLFCPRAFRVRRVFCADYFFLRLFLRTAERAEENEREVFFAPL